MFVHLRLAAALALIAILVLPGSIAQSSSSSAVARPDKKADSFRLYRYLDSKLLPLNPQTLKNIRKAKPVRLKGIYPPMAAPDGSVLVTEQYPRIELPSAKQLDIRVFDARSGKQRARFHPQDAMWVWGVSNRGKEIYGTRISSDRAPTWEVADGTTGHLLSSFTLPDRCCIGWLYDPDRSALYVLDSVPGDASQQGGVLLAYDAHSGREVARLDLPQVRTRSEVVGNDEHAIVERWLPGIALSPDGRAIAMLDGNRNHLLLVQTEGLRLVRDQALSEPQSLWVRITGWLGLSPSTAEAKRIEGVDTQIQYSPDSKHLYATGMSYGLDQRGKQTSVNLGVRVIDISSALVSAQALADSGQARAQWTDLTVAPDNSALYALTLAGTDSACPCILRRLDPRTLHTLAKRKFSSYYTSVPPVYTLP